MQKSDFFLAYVKIKSYICIGFEKNLISFEFINSEAGRIKKAQRVMATAKRNIQEFSCKVNGNEYRFKCYTTSTRCGFCHTVVSLDYDVRDTKVSYYNRTWERFTYETALRGMISKFPKGMRGAMTDQIIDGKAAEEEEKAEAMFQGFKKLHDGLNAENKERLANSGITIQSESDARAVMVLMGLMTLMQN